MSEQIDIPRNALELRDVVDAVLSRLDSGAALARAACVCRLWKEAAQVDALWQTPYESAVEDAFRRNTQSQLPGMLEAACGWRGLYVWHHRMSRRPRSRVWVDDGNGGAHLPVSLSDAAKVAAGDAVAASNHSGHLGGTSQQNFTWSPTGALVAHTLCYRSTVGILGSSIASAVIIVDVTNGRRVRVDLQVPYPPFYFLFSRCGTRLALLSNWHHMQVALRILEVPFAALAAPEPPSADVQAKMVVASLGRPLFISWSPDGRHLVQAVNSEECSILDVDEALRSGSDLGLAADFEVGRLPEAHIESLKAPLWLHDPQGRQWLLLPETSTEWPGVDAQEAEVVLVTPPLPAAAAAQSASADADPVDATAAAQPPLKVSLSGFTAGPTDVAFAATPDASAIAWLTCRLEVFIVLRLPYEEQDGSPAYSMPHMVWSRRPPVHIPRPGSNEQARRGDQPPIAMQWSPDGRRLLLLVMDGTFSGPQGVQKVRWVVWERLPGSEDSAYTICEAHHAPQEFVQSQASFFDSYAQAGTLWGPSSDAFCYSALPQGEDDHMMSDFGIYVQPVPRPEANGSAAYGDNRGVPHRADITTFVSYVGNVAVAAPSPMRIAPGRSASWSPC